MFIVQKWAALAFSKKKKIPMSLGIKNISLEKGNQVPGRSRTVLGTQEEVRVA